MPSISSCTQKGSEITCKYHEMASSVLTLKLYIVVVETFG